MEESGLWKLIYPNFLFLRVNLIKLKMNPFKYVFVESHQTVSSLPCIIFPLFSLHDICYGWGKMIRDYCISNLLSVIFGYGWIFNLLILPPCCFQLERLKQNFKFIFYWLELVFKYILMKRGMTDTLFLLVKNVDLCAAINPSTIKDLEDLELFFNFHIIIINYCHTNLSSYFTIQKNFQIKQR